MRKASILLALLLLVAVFTTAQASPARIPLARPALSFSGTTTRVNSGTSDGNISATIQLWQGSTCVATWYASGVGNLTHSASKAVTSGLQYTLTVDATVNGSSIPRVSTTKTCP